MNQAEREKRLAKAVELREQLDEVAKRIKENFSSFGTIILPHITSENDLKREAAVILGLTAMRNSAEDHIQYGSLLRRICDLLEPTVEPEA